jgi:hypothetical protein
LPNLVHTCSSENSCAIDEMKEENPEMFSAKYNNLPIRTRAFIVAVLCSGTAIKVPLLAIISTQP